MLRMLSIPPMLVALALLGGCDDLEQSCGNQVLSESRSPDGYSVATTFKRNCGATTGYAIVVAVRASATGFDGNDEKTYVFLKDGDVPAIATWEGPGALRIQRKDGRVFLEMRVFRGMRIRYNNEP